MFTVQVHKLLDLLGGKVESAVLQKLLKTLQRNSLLARISMFPREPAICHVRLEVLLVAEYLSPDLYEPLLGAQLHDETHHLLAKAMGVVHAANFEI